MWTLCEGQVCAVSSGWKGATSRAGLLLAAEQALYRWSSISCQRRLVRVYRKVLWEKTPNYLIPFHTILTTSIIFKLEMQVSVPGHGEEEEEIHPSYSLPPKAWIWCFQNWALASRLCSYRAGHSITWPWHRAAAEVTNVSSPTMLRGGHWVT